ncbi:hypothetical protein Asera_40920 [Actinocatenispora sera]|uniref:Glutathione peroxidase n=1 Tax=Actinocatenispora sera TaxID=390989 RepID=A0A810L3F1_9ACTN|nr:hypothetical protein Asera_40920 [Actinocatenispora sera]
MPDRSRRGQLTSLNVVRTEWLTPHLVRVTAGGPALAAFRPTEFTDQYVKVVFRRPGVEYPEPFDLAAAREQLPREQWPVLRTYTVRGVDADGLILDFVYHGEQGLAGPWAAGLKPGDEVLLAGPGGAYAPDPTADWHLLAGDESALPAIAAALERIPAATPAWAFIEVDGPSEQIALAHGERTTVQWVYRGAGPSLPEAVRALPVPAGRGHAFVHGEAGDVRTLRGYLFDELRLSRDQVSISGYWRRGMDDEAWRIAKRAEREADEAAEQAAGRGSENKEETVSVLDLPIGTLEGAPSSLRQLAAGNALLVVNVASKCGLTPQYTALEKLAGEYADRGLTVVGVPCNQFGEQEPGSAEEIRTFCSTTYGVSFPLTEKIEVNGAGRHPVYAALTEAADADGTAGDVQWNFEKFVLGADGSVIARHRPTTVPDDPAVLASIDTALATR